MTIKNFCDLKDEIRRHALAEGFDIVKFSDARLPEHISARLDRFLTLGRHGDMGWMKARQAERRSPVSLWPDAKTAIVFGMNYGPETNPLAALQARDQGVISVYAQNKDYHDILKKKLKQIGRQLAATTQSELKVFVDTAPIMEKPLAAQAGLGWQGKHTNLVSRQFGSWLFLGVILSTLEFQPDASEEDHCGACARCLEACPTNAFPAPYQLDARRCISYLTIEHKGPIPAEFRQAIGNRIYGCDDCLAVCPWNKFASEASELAFHARSTLRKPNLAQLASLDDPSFRQLFSGSPIKRIGRNRFIRNVAIALGNSSDKTAIGALTPLIVDESPLVRGAAIWALRRLMSPAAFQDLRAHHGSNESDCSVQAEWE